MVQILIKGHDVNLGEKEKQLNVMLNRQNQDKRKTVFQMQLISG